MKITHNNRQWTGHFMESVCKKYDNIETAEVVFYTIRHYDGIRRLTKVTNPRSALSESHLFHFPFLGESILNLTVNQL